jgi:hypothetical protein
MNIDKQTNSDDEIYTYIDQCNSNLTHYDISIIVYKVFKDSYRYIGDKNWEYLDLVEKDWKPDNKCQKLRNDIMTIVSDLFVTRSIFWHNESEKLSDVNAEILAKRLSQKMLNASFKLKNNSFISVVIKEAQSFFDFQNNES